jgi:hypothetical protein
MGKTNRNTGTWSEVVYWLRQESIFSRRRAIRTSDPETAGFLLKHADICAQLAMKLHHTIGSFRSKREED